MKKNLQFILMFVLVTLLGFTGCKKDSESGKPAEQLSLIGKWEAVSSTNGNTTNQYNWGEFIIEFTSDKKYISWFTVLNDVDIFNGAYNITGNKISVTGSRNLSMEFSLPSDNNTLILKEVINGVTQTTTYKKRKNVSIIGKWEAVTSIVRRWIAGVEQGPYPAKLYNPGESMLEFKNDGKFDTYTIEDGIYSGSYSLNDAKLTLDGLSFLYSLSESSLSIRLIDERVVDGRTHRIESTITYKRK